MAVRFSHWEGMAVEHFDEGVYASKLWFGEESGGHYPHSHLYAPPLLPTLIEFTSIADVLLRPGKPISRLTPLLPSLFAGVATLMILWWGIREWFGPAAARSTLCLASLSDFHAVYCRAALTESTLLLWFVVSLILLRRALISGRATPIVTAGLAGGLAWWTKYNGWLPLAVGGAALLACWLDVRPAGALVLKKLLIWIGVTSIALLVWCPYLASLESQGGYAVVARNHGTYLVGLAGWFDGVRQQAANVAWWDSWLTLAGGFLAGVLLSAPGGRRPWVAWMGPGLVAVAGVAWLGSGVTLLALGVIGLIDFMLAGRNRGADAAVLDRRLAGWLVAVWFFGLLLATPLYYPYPRLSLPWLAAGWIAAALGLRVMVRWCAGVQRALGTRWMVPLLVLLAGMIVAAAPSFQRKSVRVWHPRTGLATIGEAVAADSSRAWRSDAAPPSLYFVYGEPALFYHVRRAGVANVFPIADMKFILSLPRSAPTIYLLTGPHAHRSPEFAEQWSQIENRFQRMTTFEYQPSDLVLLNQYPSHQLKESPPVTQSIHLYRLR